MEFMLKLGSKRSICYPCFNFDGEKLEIPYVSSPKEATGLVPWGGASRLLLGRDTLLSPLPHSISLFSELK